MYKLKHNYFNLQMYKLNLLNQVLNILVITLLKQSIIKIFKLFKFKYKNK